MTIQRPGNLENLRTAAAARTAATAARADAGLREMLRAGQPVTFRGLARHAGVSLDFLYSNTALRQRIQQLRDQQRTQPGSTARHDSAGGDPAGDAGPEATSSVVATLTAQLTGIKRRHREDTARLRRELEAAHGENLLLRRRLGAGHDPGPRENS
ncbi:MAG TPA: DUF6262 family protein [Streptosporangiaceae bacterium]|nr:DUF6262 family protein [Streptosporangiaceae bacterium]